MAERGETAHGPGLDDKMKQETDGMVKGNNPAHAEEWRESEPFADDTDPDAVRDALDPTRRVPADADEYIEDQDDDEEGPQ
ncbi:hypothetical protein F8G81_18365 [Arthrobacter sp. CDRTa11]|uniref:hypothetical protein n=1 Tax=Arthrobacter sp. CDRTa11 TaxID=2651199 RepID=UPI00226580CB|nr:hypothetical protein [Arthrobacter sp. CDRTa11]UZX04355.1 hypothetical protein F8G81_18365 [Arthrobacter sp. CDRTa11]